jgi:WD40 repeat protein
MIPLKKKSFAVLLIFLTLVIPPALAADYTDLASSADKVYTIKTEHDSILHIFENRNNSEVWSYDVHGTIGSAAFSPDGNHIVVGSAGGLIWLFNQDGIVVWNKTFGNAGIRSIEFSPDGQYIDASSYMNQAFYLSLDGTPATRPAAASATVIPSVVPPVPAAQIPAVPDLFGIGSVFGTHQNIVPWIIAGIVLLCLVWIVVSRPGRQKDSRGFFRNVITLRNFTFLSLILVAIGGILLLYLPADAGGTPRTIIILGLAGILIAYFLYAVTFWGSDEKLLAALMLAIPLTLYYVSTTRVSESPNIVLNILIIIIVYAVIAAVLLFITDAIRVGVGSRRSRYFTPDSSYILPGIVVISLIMVSMGSLAILSENTGSVLKSVTGITAGTQSPASVQTPDQIFSVPQNTITSVPATSSASLLDLLPLTPKNLETGPTTRSFAYVVRGNSRSIPVSLYSGVFDEISAKPPPVTCTRYNYDSSPCTSEEVRQYYLKFIDEPTQKKYLDALVHAIESQVSGRDEQARIAISLVQQIPYDSSRLYSATFRMRTPYEVLYENKGVCSEKSVLLAYLLRELGYGVVLFEFDSESHMAVGVRCPGQYAYKNSGYAFIETATPSIPTDSQGDYIGAGKLTSTPRVLQISDGNSFSSIAEEFQDALAYNQLGTGRVLPPAQYRQWEILMWKYGMKSSDGTTFRENPSDKPLCDDGGILCNGQCYESCGFHYIAKCTASGIVCQGDPNNCPPGETPCNGQCYRMCIGSSPRCEARGLVCYY